MEEVGRVERRVLRMRNSGSHACWWREGPCVITRSASDLRAIHRVAHQSHTRKSRRDAQLLRSYLSSRKNVTQLQHFNFSFSALFGTQLTPFPHTALANALHAV